MLHSNLDIARTKARPIKSLECTYLSGKWFSLFFFIRTAEKKCRIEAAQSQLDGISFEFANRRNHKPCEKRNSNCNTSSFVFWLSEFARSKSKKIAYLRFCERNRIFLRNCKSSSICCIILTDTRMKSRLVLPKHMPQSPWRIVSMITQPMSPLHSTPNTSIMKINTRAVWPHITTNCVTTWENRISPGDTPATQLRSSRPSILSIISADDVSATARKKTILSTRDSFEKSRLHGKDFLKCLREWKKEIKSYEEILIYWRYNDLWLFENTERKSRNGLNKY